MLTESFTPSINNIIFILYHYFQINNMDILVLIIIKNSLKLRQGNKKLLDFMIQSV